VTRARTRADDRHVLPAAARTAHRSHARHGGCASRSDGRASPRATTASPRGTHGVRLRRTGSCASFRAVTGFYIAGCVLAVWALLVSALGVMREDFPSSAGASRLVGAISVLLVVAAIGTAVYL
jgi:hypothetical protein